MTKLIFVLLIGLLHGIVLGGYIVLATMEDRRASDHKQKQRRAEAFNGLGILEDSSYDE